MSSTLFSLSEFYWLFSAISEDPKYGSKSKPTLIGKQSSEKVLAHYLDQSWARLKRVMEIMWKESSLGIHYVASEWLLHLSVMSWVKEWIWKSDAGFFLAEYFTMHDNTIHTVWFSLYHVKQTSSKNKMPRRITKMPRMVSTKNQASLRSSWTFGKKSLPVVR